MKQLNHISVSYLLFANNNLKCMVRVVLVTVRFLLKEF